ncbi:hypothetical protein [Acinetobacter baumannii]|uniref:hypothetical protein n=1 Tax=Acinetobacter baumannii TaxID=470 RepID=UPI001125FEA8|nr:hypothetical protein [Acinetobacter baumannii]TPT55490.1 hypothetical protein FJU64_08140 [Acinetobacter baumannii]
MNNFPETFEVEHFNGKKGLLDKCRVDSNGAIFSKGDVNALENGDLLVRTQPNGYTQRLRVEWISSKTNPMNGAKEIKVVGI